MLSSWDFVVCAVYSDAVVSCGCKNKDDGLELLTLRPNPARVCQRCPKRVLKNDVGVNFNPTPLSFQHCLQKSFRWPHSSLSEGGKMHASREGLVASESSGSKNSRPCGGLLNKNDAAKRLWTSREAIVCCDTLTTACAGRHRKIRSPWRAARLSSRPTLKKNCGTATVTVDR